MKRFPTSARLFALIATLILAACGQPTSSVPPSAPEVLTTVSGPGYVDLAWQHGGGNVQTFAIYRTEVGGLSAFGLSSTAEPLVTVGGAARTYRDEGVTIGAGYTYAIVAQGVAGASASTMQSGAPSWASCAAPSDVIEVADTNLASAIRGELQLGDDAVTCGAIESLTHLVAAGAGIESLAGLQNATALVTLNLNSNAIRELWPISASMSIEHLQLSSNDIEDLSDVAGLTKLRVFMVSGNPIDTIEVVEAFDDLMYLGAAQTAVSDIGVLAGKADLIYLWLNDLDGITDFSPLATLPALSTLMVGGTLFGDDDMPMLAGMPALSRLQLWATEVSDLSALQDLNLDFEIDIGGTHVTDLTPIHHMTSLKQVRLAWLNLDEADVGFLDDFDELEYLNLHGNALTSVAPVVALTALDDGDYVDLRFNLLDLGDAGVLADLELLADRGVYVEYEPQRED